LQFSFWLSATAAYSSANLTHLYKKKTDSDQTKILRDKSTLSLNSSASIIY
jgi:hypothetical protein